MAISIEDVWAETQNIKRDLGAVSEQVTLDSATLANITTILTNTNTAITNLATIYGIVPTLNMSATGDGSLYVPTDRYYALLGAIDASAKLPAWMQSVANVTYATWDATDKRFYMTLSSAAATGLLSGNSGGATAVRLFHYGGVAGVATTHSPKNAAVTTLTLQFRARFNANADYTTYGVGLMYRNGGGTAATALFDTAATHFIQVLRNGAAWELGSCDGTTISQSSGGTGDGSLHDFKMTWTSTTLTLFVDGVSTITKATNLPTQPLAAHIVASDNTNTIDIVDYLVSWS